MLHSACFLSRPRSVLRLLLGAPILKNIVFPKGKQDFSRIGVFAMCAVFCYLFVHLVLSFRLRGSFFRHSWKASRLLLWTSIFHTFSLISVPKIAKIFKNRQKNEDKTPTRKKERPESDFELILVDLGIPWGKPKSSKKRFKKQLEKQTLKKARTPAEG